MHNKPENVIIIAALYSGWFFVKILIGNLHLLLYALLISLTIWPKPVKLEQEISHKIKYFIVSKYVCMSFWLTSPNEF